MRLTDQEYRNGVSRRSFLKKVAAASLCGVFTDIGGTLGDRPVLSQKSAAQSHIAGKFVPVMLTPFKYDLSIDFELLKRLTDFYQQAGAEGMFANCLSSEMYSLTPAERLSLADHAVRYTNAKDPVVATGSFGDSLEDKAVFTKKMYDQGVDAVILITGHFAGKQESDHVFIKNMENFLQRSQDIPLGTYECPSPYKRLLSPEVYSFLLESGRFIYHKDTSEDIEQIKAKLRLSENSQLQLFNAHTASAAPSLKAGAAGLSPISGNFYPEIIHWICKNAHLPEKEKDVEWIQSEISLTEPVISRTYPFSAKYFLHRRGLPIELRCRAHQRTLDNAGKEALETVYKKFQKWCDRLGIQPVNCC